MVSIQKLIESGFIEIKNDNLFILDLRYGSTNNFVGKNLYGDFQKAFLHKVAAQKMFRAADELQTLKPGYKFIIFDALRPRSVQHLLWNAVVGTAFESYIANPHRGSVHNFGMAVDLSIVDESGKELDMGTPFDDFTELAQPKKEEENLLNGKLTSKQKDNRMLLRKLMVDAGFIQLPHEWWHYDAMVGDDVRAQFTIIE